MSRSLLRRLTAVEIVVTYIMIVFGGFVASSDSGLGCGPDWPLCNGLLVPLLHGTTLVEYTHRLIGLVIILVAAVLLVGIWRQPWPARRRTMTWAAIVLVIQVLLGAVTVFLELPPLVTTAHLLTALVFLSLLLLLQWQLSPQTERHQGDVVKNRLLVALVLLLVTVTLGAYIKHAELAMACGWLTCPAGWPAGAGQWLQSLHRLLAICTAAAIWFITWEGEHSQWGRRVQVRLRLASVLAALQVILGIAMVISHISVGLAVAHLAVAVLIAMLLVDSIWPVSVSSGMTAG